MQRYSIALRRFTTISYIDSKTVSQGFDEVFYEYITIQIDIFTWNKMVKSAENFA